MQVRLFEGESKVQNRLISIHSDLLKVISCTELETDVSSALMEVHCVCHISIIYSKLQVKV